MRLDFQGHNRLLTTEVQASELRRRCRGRHGNSGCFVHNGTWTENDDVLTVRFRPTIYINSALTGSERNEVLRHERRHHQDFRRRATQLKRDLTAAIRRRQDPQMSARWSWFLYDLCTDSAAFHRSVGAPVEICSRPGNPRP